MQNHLGQIECKLCLTVHNNEGNYLAHTQGKRHQENLGRRAAKEAQEADSAGNFGKASAPKVEPRKTIKIGRPGYRVTRQRDPDSGQVRNLLLLALLVVVKVVVLLLLLPVLLLLLLLTRTSSSSGCCSRSTTRTSRWGCSRATAS